MTTLDVVAKAPVKLIILGDSGSGKTGSLASLANAGYELFIQDFDNGAGVLAPLVKPEFHKSVHVAPLVDRVRITQLGPVCDGRPEAFAKSCELLDSWREGDTKFGGVREWDRNRILVIDSLTMQGQAILRLIRHDDQTPPSQNTHPSQWGKGQDRQEGVLEQLFDPSIRCHIIVLAHIAFIGGEDSFSSMKPKEESIIAKPQITPAPRVEKGYPSALGKKLPPRIGRFFNTLLLAKTNTVTGRRELCTIPEQAIDVKCPVKLPSPLPIETGLLTVFEALVGPIGEVGHQNQVPRARYWQKLADTLDDGEDDDLQRIH